MKRLLAALLSVLMVATLLVGCGNKDAQDTNQTDDSDKQNQEEINDQLAAIQAAGKLVVGVEGTYYPYTYHDETTNELDGYDIQVAKKLADYLGVEVEFVESDWDSLLAGLDSGRLDTVINDVTATDERREKYDFSTPYFYSFRQFVVKTGNEVGIHSVEDLNGKKIATNTTNSLVPLLEEWGVEIVPIDNTDQCAQMVESGRVDFCMFSAVVMKEYMSQHPEAQLEVAFVLEDSVNEICIPTRKGETRLLNEIDNFLQSIRDDGTLLELCMKYFDADYCTDPRTK